MLNLRPILYILGLLLLVLAAAMLIPMTVDLLQGQHIQGQQNWQAFAIGAAITAYVAVTLIMVNRQEKLNINVRQTFVLTSLIWIAIPLFSAIPMMIGTYKLSFTDAFFEAMSGLTTCGATILTGLDSAPPGLLLWRSMLQWLGGVGIIVMAVAIMPMLQVGGMQLFKTESSDVSEKMLPRVNQITSNIAAAYLVLTTLCMFFYFAGGMGGFDAINHAMTTIATGGFSTHDASMAHFYDRPFIEWTSTFFMFISGLPFLLLVRFAKGNGMALLNNSQVKAYTKFCLIIIIGIALFRANIDSNTAIPFLELLRKTAFNVVSVVTGTGYASRDFATWHEFAVLSLLFLMFVGGCAGSTTCGFKFFRLQILYGQAMVQMKRLLQPHGVFRQYYNGNPVANATVDAVVAFLVFYVLCLVISTLALSGYGLDMVTSLSASASALSNVGPGLGPIVGPTSTYASVPEGAKWVLSMGMLLGRLEFFTVLVLLTPMFWKK